MADLEEDHELTRLRAENRMLRKMLDALNKWDGNNGPKLSLAEFPSSFPPELAGGGTVEEPGIPGER